MDAYVPTKATKDVVICLTPLGMEYDSYPERQTIINSNPDKIIIFNDAWERQQLLDELHTLGVGDDANIQIYTNSAGDKHSFLTASFLKTNGYNPSEIVILDPAHKFNDVNSAILTDEVVRNLADSHTSVVVACQYDRTGVNSWPLQRLIGAGIPLSYIHIARDDLNWSGNHSFVKNHLLENGIIEFLFGDSSTLNNGIYDGCSYSVYDYENNAWIDNLSMHEYCKLIGYGNSFEFLDSRLAYLKKLAPLDAKETAKNLGYTDAITSNQEYVIDTMNDIRVGITGTNFIGKLNNSFGNIGGNPVLDLENAILAQHFSISGALLDKIVKQTETISLVAFDYQKLDEKLTQLSGDTDSLTLKDLLTYDANTKQETTGKEETTTTTTYSTAPSSYYDGSSSYVVSSAVQENNEPAVDYSSNSSDNEEKLNDASTDTHVNASPINDTVNAKESLIDKPTTVNETAISDDEQTPSPKIVISDATEDSEFVDDEAVNNTPIIDNNDLTESTVETIIPNDDVDSNNTYSQNMVKPQSNNNTIKTIGKVAVGAAAIGGGIYMGNKFIKKAKGEDDDLSEDGGI